MCGVTPPRSLIDPIFDAMFAAIQQSPVRIRSCRSYGALIRRFRQSWKVRLKALPLIQGAYSRFYVE
jgi:proteasome activator subunit 4